jgi:uncharacterized protein
MFYIDTSVIVTALTHEAMTPDIRNWFVHNDHESFAVSDWVTTEFSSTIAMKVRTEHLTSSDGREAHILYNDMVKTAYINLPVTSACFQKAADLCKTSKVALRSGDALHLAVAINQSAALCTRDIRLHEAAVSFGHKSILL